MVESIVKNDEINMIKNTPLGVSFKSIRYYPPHSHDECLEILFCMKGSVTIVSADQEIILHSGDIFSIDPEDIHSVSSDSSDNLLIVLHINMHELSIPYEKLRYAFFTCRSDHMSSQQRKISYSIIDSMLTIAYMFASEEYSNDDYISRQYKYLADSMVKIMLENYELFDYVNSYQSGSRISRERFGKLSAYCQQNYMNKITLKGLAADEYINENYLSQFMAKSPYGSFSNMINYIRCYESEQLLVHTDLSNLEISYRCGFSDTKYFYRHFRKWYGRTPREHKKLIKEKLQLPANYRTVTTKEIYPQLQAFISHYHTEKIREFLFSDHRWSQRSDD